VYHQQQQEQQEQEQEQEQDAENPFLDPPFSRKTNTRASLDQVATSSHLVTTARTE
jgi:hypothetical protein